MDRDINPMVSEVVKTAEVYGAKKHNFELRQKVLDRMKPGSPGFHVWQMFHKFLKEEYEKL